MKPQLQKAAQRLRKMAVEGQDIPGYSTMQVVKDSSRLAGAYLSEHQEDDDELVTEEWVRSIAPRHWEAGKNRIGQNCR